jgi:hypothetical protein
MVGGGGGASQSKSQNYQAGTAADPNQLPYLQNLWQGAQGYMGQGQQTAQQGQDWIGNAANSMMGQFSPQNVQGQMDYYGKQIGQQFREQIMPQIQGQAALAGGLGSSRNQLAQGYAGAQAQQGIQNMGNALFNQNQDRALQAAGAIPAMANAFGNMGWQPYQNYAGILGQMQQQDLGGYSKSKSSSMSAQGKVGGGG